jgi:ribosomal protein L12E/L44/L45/RPP1/RPP2
MFTRPNERCLIAIQARITNLEAELDSLKELLASLTNNTPRPVISFTNETYMAILTSDPDSPPKKVEKKEEKEEKKESKEEKRESKTAADPQVCRSPVKPPEPAPSPAPRIGYASFD